MFFFQGLHKHQYLRINSYSYTLLVVSIYLHLMKKVVSHTKQVQSSLQIQFLKLD